MDFVKISLWLVAVILSTYYCDASSYGQYSLPENPNVNEGDCFCINRPGIQTKAPDILYPGINNIERLVIYLYRNKGNPISIYIPNKEKQLIIPDLPFEDGDNVLKSPNNLENVFNLLNVPTKYYETESQPPITITALTEKDEVYSDIIEPSKIPQTIQSNVEGSYGTESSGVETEPTVLNEQLTETENKVILKPTNQIKYVTDKINTLPNNEEQTTVYPTILPEKDIDIVTEQIDNINRKPTTESTKSSYPIEDTESYPQDTSNTNKPYYPTITWEPSSEKITESIKKLYPVTQTVDSSEEISDVTSLPYTTPNLENISRDTIDYTKEVITSQPITINEQINNSEKLTVSDKYPIIPTVDIMNPKKTTAINQGLNPIFIPKAIIIAKPNKIDTVTVKTDIDVVDYTKKKPNVPIPLQGIVQTKPIEESIPAMDAINISDIHKNSWKFLTLDDLYKIIQHIKYYKDKPVHEIWQYFSKLIKDKNEQNIKNELYVVDNDLDSADDNLNDSYKFDQWFKNQMNGFLQSGNLLSDPSIKHYVMNILQQNGMIVTSEGILTDVYGNALDLRDFKLRPIVIGKPLKVKKMLANRKDFMWPSNSTLMQAIVMVLSNPTMILGIIPLGKATIKHSVNSEVPQWPDRIKHWIQRGNSLYSDADNIQNYINPTKWSNTPYVHYLNNTEPNSMSYYPHLPPINTNISPDTDNYYDSNQNSIKYYLQNLPKLQKAKTNVWNKEYKNSNDPQTSNIYVINSEEKIPVGYQITSVVNSANEKLNGNPLDILSLLSTVNKNKKQHTENQPKQTLTGINILQNLAQWQMKDNIRRNDTGIAKAQVSDGIMKPVRNVTLTLTKPQNNPTNRVFKASSGNTIRPGVRFMLGKLRDGRKERKLRASDNQLDRKIVPRSINSASLNKISNTMDSDVVHSKANDLEDDDKLTRQLLSNPRAVNELRSMIQLNDNVETLNEDIPEEFEIEEDDEYYDIQPKIIGGSAATSSGAPLNIRGRMKDYKF